MINISKEQLKELDGIYQMSHKCKDPETKKLVKAIFDTIDFIDLEHFSIDSGYFYYTRYDNYGYPYGPKYFKMSEARTLGSLPIVVILYLITKDDKYLKPSKYVKGSVIYNRCKRKYIKFSNTCYFIDKIYTIFNTYEVFKIN